MNIRTGLEVAFKLWNLIYYFFLVCYISVEILSYMNRLYFPFFKNGVEFMGEIIEDLNTLEQVYVIEEYMQSVMVSLMFLAIMKVFQYSALLGLYLNTMSKAFKILSGYFIFTIVVMLVFALLAHNLMGDMDPLYSNYFDCVGQMMAILVGRLNMVNLRSNHYTSY